MRNVALLLFLALAAHATASPPEAVAAALAPDTRTPPTITGVLRIDDFTDDAGVTTECLWIEDVRLIFSTSKDKDEAEKLKAELEKLIKPWLDENCAPDWWVAENVQRHEVPIPA